MADGFFKIFQRMGESYGIQQIRDRIFNMEDIILFLFNELTTLRDPELSNSLIAHQEVLRIGVRNCQSRSFPHTTVH